MHFILDIFASMVKQILFLAALISSISAKSQFSFQISGNISDKTTGEALMGVQVILEGWHVESFTNRYGHYNISSPPQDIVLRIEYAGYEPYIDTLYIENDLILNVSLTPSESGEFDQVNPPRNQNEVTDVQGNRIDMPIRFTRKIPYMVGETDLIKGLQTLPGVKFGNEGFSNLFVRGGSADQNLFLLDGAPVYYSNHLFGLFSIYNPEAINNVQLTKGGFTSRYGGRLSSVVDITTNEGSSVGNHGSASLTPLSLKLSLSGGFKNKKTTYALSLRRSYFDLLIRPFFFAAGADFAVYFQDLNFKLAHTLNDKNKIILSYYYGRDLIRQEFSETDTTNTNTVSKYKLSNQWNNQVGSIRWNSSLNRRLFISTAFMFSRYQNQENLSEEIKINGNSQGIASVLYKSGINDILVHSDAEFHMSSQHHIRFGLQSSFRNINTSYFEEEGKNFPAAEDYLYTYGSKKNPIRSEIALYGEDEIKLSTQFKINGGLRLVVYRHESFATLKPEPRLQVRFQPHDNYSLKASYHRVNQFIHQVSASNNGSLNTFWAPATADIKPQFSDQITLNYTRSFNNGYQLLIDAYWKKMQNLVIISNESEIFDINADWEKYVAQGEGRSYGLEILFKKNYGKVSSWYGYCLSKSDRRFEILNQGEYFPFNFDRRHQINMLWQFWMSDLTSISTNLVIGSGNPFTLPQGRYIDIDGREVLDYGKLNNYRTGRYTRLDIGLNRNYGDLTDKITHELNFSIYNFFFRKNPSLAYATEITDSFGNKLYKAYEESYFVFIPGVYYILKF